ncbi:MAG: type II toxin-antitoxin system prevent-host-death family antitoxin [Coriobacteriia bacterium]|nr:type II toxin-antitoxin system prevent-host-death family antitoxin [Coriobacteriia bacterium]
MRIIPATEARSSLPAMLDAVAAGESFVLTRHGRPVARLVPLDERGGAFMAAEAPAPYGAAVAEMPGVAVGPQDPRLLGSPLTARLLGVFAGAPEREFYQRELVAATAGSLRSVQRALARLVSDGRVVARQHGNRVYYRAAVAPASGDVIALALRTALAPLGDRLRLALIFGSVARGDQRPDSDVDLLLVGDVTRWDVVPLIRQVEREIGREVGATLYDPAEFRRRARTDDFFVAELLAGPNIAIKGALDELK